MINKITIFFLLLALNTFSQGVIEDQYNGFSSRNFMKFNSFLLIPTFSILNKKHQTIEIISRNSNIAFQDASKLYFFSYSGKMRNNIGAGFSVFQQEINVFKDFGAIANYAYRAKTGKNSFLTLGFNFIYSRRGLQESVVISNPGDKVINNYQDKPVIVFQPAVTFSVNNFFIGFFAENLADYNLKRNSIITDFKQKIFSVHAGFLKEFKKQKGILSNAKLYILVIAKKSMVDGFSYSGNVLLNLPRLGWVKGGYDKNYGFNAGLGVNLSQRLSIGFGYEKQLNLGVTNEVGLIYRLGKRKNYDNKSYNYDESDKNLESSKIIEKNNEILERNNRLIQDSIKKLNKKVDKVINLLKNNINNNTNKSSNNTNNKAKAKEKTKKLSLKRSSKRSWRKKNRKTTITKESENSGVRFYVALNQFKDIEKVKKAVSLYETKNLKVKYVNDPQTDYNVIYINDFSRKEDADNLVKKINGKGQKGFEDDEENDLGIKIKSLSNDPVYVVAIDFGNSVDTETYSEPKKQPPAKIKTLKLGKDVEPGYYLQVSVNSLKSYADKFVDELVADGFNAKYFINPKTGYMHVYIFKTKNKQNIIKLYKNNFNNTYYDLKNIIHIK